MTEKLFARIDDYLFGEMNAQDQEMFESAVVEDDELHFAVVDRENEIVDRCAARSLDSETLRRFERSISAFPARRQKLANAHTLNTYIAETTPMNPAVDVRKPWYRKLGFAFRTPAIAASVLGMILIGSIGALLVQNRDQNEVIARLEQASSLNSGLDDLRKREAELQTILADERSAAGDLTSDLETERNRRTKLEADIKELRKQVANSRPSNDSPIVPTIGTIVLSSASGSDNSVSLNSDQERISVKITLPSNVDPAAVVTVKLNGDNIGSQMRPQVDTKGTRSIIFFVLASRFHPGTNQVEVFDAKGKQISTFNVTGN